MSHVTAKANKTKYALDDVEVAPCLPSLLTLTDSTGEALTYVARPGPSSMKGTDSRPRKDSGDELSRSLKRDRKSYRLEVTCKIDQVYRLGNMQDGQLYGHTR